MKDVRCECGTLNFVQSTESWECGECDHVNEAEPVSELVEDAETDLENELDYLRGWAA